jgi:hypothetical protein
MLEQLKTVLLAESYASMQTRNHANGLAARCSNDLAAVGVVPTADTGSASSIAGAISLAKATVAAQSLSATFSASQQQLALGRLGQLSDQLASLGLT